MQKREKNIRSNCGIAAIAPYSNKLQGAKRRFKFQVSKHFLFQVLGRKAPFQGTYSLICEGFSIHGDGASCLLVSTFHADTRGGVAGGDGDGSRRDRHVVVGAETHAF